MTISLSGQWDRMIRLTEMFLTQHADSTELSEKYVAMLEMLRADQVFGEECALGLYRAPASQSRHHAFEGGLVAHLLQMFDIWVELGLALRTQTALPEYLTDNAFVWRAILHHDLNKVWKYKLVTADPWKVDYAPDPLSKLLTDTHKSLQILGRMHITLPVVLHSALITAEGGFSATRPKVESVFSKVIYLLDELSANVVDRLQRDAFWDSKIGGINEVP